MGSNIRSWLSLYLLSAFVVIAEPAFAGAKDWTLVQPTYAPCPGIGVAGTFTAKVHAEYEKKQSGYLLNDLVVTIDSPAFRAGTPAASGAVSVGNSKVLLVKPWYLTVGPPGLVELVMPSDKSPADRSDRKQKPLTLPDSKLRIEVTPVVTMNSGSCPLATLAKDLEF